MAGFGSLAPDALSDEDVAALSPETFVNPVAKKVVGGLASGLAQHVGTPGAVMAPNPYPEGSEEADWYEDQRKNAMVNFAGQRGMAALMPMPMLQAAKTAVLGSGAINPLKSPLSKVNLPRPLSDVERGYMDVNPAPPRERLVSPEALQGSVLMPVMGDTTAAGRAVTHVGDIPLDRPVPLKGGHGYMSETPGQAWANLPGAATTLSTKAADIAEKTGMPVHFVYSAMNPRAVDFQKSTADVLAQMAQKSPITRGGEITFDRKMRLGSGSHDPVPDFPGIRSDELPEWLRTASSGMQRAKFAKIMDKSEMLKSGFPSVGEARYAVSDPRLLKAPLGGSGMSIARVDPTGTTVATTHPTFTRGIPGEYVGGFGQSLPAETMFPDIAAAYRRNSPSSRFDYLASRLTPPYHQIANQEWLDKVMPHWIRGAGMLGEE